MANTATSVLHAFANPTRLFKRAAAYHHAPTVESTEMGRLTTCSNDDLSAEQPKSRSEKATSTRTSKVASIQRYRQRFSGWRFGVLNFAFCALAVFLVNLIATIWGSVTHKATEGVLSEGDCERIKTLNSGVHIVINVLSTILLSGSNYCMQCLSAPTRGEVDKAHAARKWLDIGVPSFRNLKHISRRRLILWLLLGSSSIPLHLLYNSAIYASLSTNSYDAFVVNQAFVDDSECRNCTNAGPRVMPDAEILKDLWSKSKNGSLDKLDPIDCVKDYATLIQSKRRNVLLVTANDNVDPSQLDPAVQPNPSDPWFNLTNVYQASRFDASQGLSYYQNEEALDWICSGLPYVKGSPPCIGRIKEITNPSHKWMVAGECGGYCNHSGRPVDYCLSERAVPHCKLRFNPVIAIIVTVLNIFKAVLMFCVVYLIDEDPIMTMGDAIGSFLDERDIVTKDIGLLSRHDFKKGYSTGATTWHDSSWRWKDATSKKRRTVTIIL
ncbi:hypothetical protein N0V94_007729 [Neodidymelliopsis sp. IMI 364377]|nr:hypothetical protein N0V94_007729 [Neodidymelliopsis sp. IMI 364377]